MTTWSDWLTAIGTIGVCILAIWGDAVKAWIAGPKLRLVPHNLGGNYDYLNLLPPHAEFSVKLPSVRIPAFFYHLKVINARPWSPARNVKVLLSGVLRKSPLDGKFVREPVPVKRQLTWAPAESSDVAPTISKEHILDLGYIAKDVGFVVATYSTSTNYRAVVPQQGAIRVELEIIADNFYLSKPYVYEIEWDGIWTDALIDIRSHLKISETDSP